MNNPVNHFRGTKEYSFVYTELITAAKYRGTVTYQEIAKILGMPTQGNNMGRVIGLILGEISRDETAKGRPMLSAVATNVNGSPGKGFFLLARELGRITDKDSEITFWQRELKLVYTTWKVVLKHEIEITEEQD